MGRLPFIRFFVLLAIALSVLTFSDGGSIGVNYGRIANNLPSASRVVQLLKSHGITQVKLFDADPSVLRSLAHSNISVVIDLPNSLLPLAARRPSFSFLWLRRNLLAYHPATLISTLAVGNELTSPTDPFNPSNSTNPSLPFLLPAIRNLHAALLSLNPDPPIKISSPIALSALSTSYPSSAGAFQPHLVASVFKPLLTFLRSTASPLMVNAYPFFAYESNSDVISLDYALFRPNPGVVDAGSGIRYLNLFDAQIDAVFAALSALGFDDVNVVVSETGWPSKGDPSEAGASVANAAAYNGNLVRHILAGGGGTPRRPRADLTVYLFALFNEDEKPGPTSERNYGLFYPNEESVYEIPFTVSGLRRYRDVAPSSPPEARAGGGKGTTPPPRGDVSTSGGGKGTWCVAGDGAAKDQLQKALDYACGEGGADCRPIQANATCYEPNTVEAHASYAFNSYYQKQGRRQGSCYFGGAAAVVSQPPRYGSCVFPTGY